MDHDQVAEVLAAYALDAVEGDEVVAIEAHLSECAPCRAELDRYREVVGHLSPPAVAVPHRLWVSTAEATTTPIHGISAPDRHMSRGRRLAAIAAVVILALGAGTAISEIRHSGELQDEQEIAERSREAAAAFADPTARHVNLRSGDGKLALQAAVLPDGSGYLLGDALPTLDGDMTYQVWAMTPAGPTSAGVVGRRPRIEPIRLSVPTASALAVTREPRGGEEAPTSPPLVQGTLPAHD